MRTKTFEIAPAASIAILRNEPDQVVAIRKVNEEFGWMGNMSPHPVIYAGLTWRTGEAVFEARRFDDLQVREAIRLNPSPMGAKFVAKRFRSSMIIVPQSDADVA